MFHYISNHPSPGTHNSTPGIALTVPQMGCLPSASVQIMFYDIILGPKVYVDIPESLSSEFLRMLELSQV